MLHIIQKQQKLKKLKLLKFGIMKSKENTTFKLKSQETNL